MAYSVIDASAAEGREVPFGVFRPLRPALGLTAFGINQLELSPNAEGPEHDHSADGQEEVYIIVDGAGSIRVDSDVHELEPGMVVFCSPDQRRQMMAGPEGLAWIGIGCQPDGYKPREG